METVKDVKRIEEDKSAEKRMDDRSVSGKGMGRIRRCLDVFFSFLLLLILLPVLLIISAVIILHDSSGGAIYKHKRVGLHGRIFTMYKFRTMKCGLRAEDVFSSEELKQYRKEFKVKNDPRITKVGAFLRRTSLDELPQLINILKGDMSFVGPRPVTYEETILYGESRDLLLSVKPGLTGYWQAYARNAVTYEDGKRQEMELYYVKNQSFLLDIKILFKTVKKVLSRKDVY